MEKIKEELAIQLEKYKNGQEFKDYFVSMKEISDWLKEQEK